MALKPSSIRKRSTNDLVGRQVGEDAQGQRRLALEALKAVPQPTHGIGSGNEALGGQPRSASASDVFPVARDGPEPDLPPQLGMPRSQSTMTVMCWGLPGQFPEQFHGGVHPGAALGGLVERQATGMAQLLVEHADGRGLPVGSPALFEAAFGCGLQMGAGPPPG